ncbi:MAG: TrsE protein [Herbinix sp.]|jgi:uncharacterized protein YlzI (FlbEa/FlbD family)|nr:TrsE protein [Herbinix sp.]
MVAQIYQQTRDIISGGSGFYMGPTGTGKTFAIRNEIEHVLNNTDEIAFVISRHGEYDDLVEKHGGILIDLAKEPLNPLLILDADKIKKEDLGFLSNIKSGLVKLMVETKINKLSALQKYLIEQVTSKMCFECGNVDWNQYVLAFNKMIESYKEKNVAERLDEIKASLSGIATDLNLTKLNTDSILMKETFLEELKAVADAVLELGSMANGTTQVSIGDSRLVVYDVKNLPKEEVDKYSLLAVEDVWTRLNGVNPIKHARLCIDDADNMFKEYDKYMSMLYKVARNQGLVISSVIHDTDIFLSKKAVFRKISSYYEIFKHSKNMIEVLTPIFSLSKEEADWLLDAPEGQKLVICAGKRFLIKAISK